MKYLKVEQVAARYGVHKKTIWEWARTKPEFPKPQKLSPRVTRWQLTDIEAYEQRLSSAA